MEAPYPLGGGSCEVLNRGFGLSVVLLAFTVGASPPGGFDPSCPAGDPLPSSEVLIGYIGNVRNTSDERGSTRVGSFRPLGILRDGDLEPTDGASIREGMRFWQVLAPSAAPTIVRHVSSFLDRLGEDHCVFHGEPAAELPVWSLLSSRPLAEVFHPPTAIDRSYFSEHHDVCVDQGDYDPSEKPPCSRPELLAVSDLNRDGLQEYWATQPYLWDTGITVWRRSPTGLLHLLEVCSGCSD